MPEMSGIEVLKILKEEFPLLPVIVVSGVGIVDDVVEAIRCGAWDYILKPIHDFAILKHSIDLAFEKACLLKENREYQERLEEMVHERTRELHVEIEHRKAAEEKLHESQKMLESILETVPDIIYRVNEKGQINFISNAVTNYGFTPYEFMGRDIHEFVHPDDYAKSWWHLKTRRTGERKTRNFEVRLFKNPHNQKYPVFMLESEGVFRDNKKQIFVGTQGVMRDISLRKKAENEVKKSLKEKESLLREIHHRVKNNMQIILSLLSLQMKEIKNQEVQDILLESQNRIMSMAIVHESIYKTDNFTEIDMEYFIKSLYSQIAQSYNIKNAITFCFFLEKIYVSLDSSVPLSIILNEIFSNIYKHAFDSFENATVTVKMKKLKNNRGRIICEDNGCGLPKNINTNEPVTMGLSLIKNLTKQINGDLIYEELNPGTRIIITFDTQIIYNNF
jgi:PAS domain S-box-containing protein